MRLRVVLDTNIFISAILYGGNPRQVVNLAISEAIEVYISPNLLDELRRTLIEKFSFNSIEVDRILSEIKDFSEIATSQVRLQVVKTDLSDDRVLECALEAKAGIIVSGDKHLLNLGEFRGIKIVTPAEFLRKHKAG